MPDIDDAKRTLFAHDATDVPSDLGDGGATYPLFLQNVATADDQGFDATEVAAFSHVIEHEVSFYESRGVLTGPLHLIAHGESIDCGKISPLEGSLGAAVESPPAVRLLPR